MSKIIKIFIFVIVLNIWLNSYADWDNLIINNNSSSWSGKTSTIAEKISSEELKEELKKDWIELNSAPSIQPNDKNILGKAIDKKNTEMDKLMWKTDEVKNIEAIESVLMDLEIKKWLDSSQLNQIQENLKILQKSIEKNNKDLDLLKDGQNIKEISNKLTSLEISNKSLNEDLELKKSLVKDLQESLAWYNILEAKYKNLLQSYVWIKKEKESSILKDKEQKLFYLIAFLILFSIIYIIRILLVRNVLFKKKHPNFWEYFDLIYWISIVVFLVMYIFYLFPELYVLLIFISGSLIFINAQVISSFIASIIIFRHYKIWDVIKIWTEKWKIIKINPLSTIIRRINSYWILENDEVWIPNIDLIKEKIIIAKNNNSKENEFSIILSLKWKNDIFSIISYIKEEILIKMINERLNGLDYKSNDKFETKYEYIDEDKLKIVFYWIWTKELNRKIEKRIIQYIKESVFYWNTTWTNDEAIEKKWKIANSNDTLTKKVYITEEWDADM